MAFKFPGNFLHDFHQRKEEKGKEITKTRRRT